MRRIASLFATAAVGAIEAAKTCSLWAFLHGAFTYISRRHQKCMAHIRTRSQLRCLPPNGEDTNGVVSKRRLPAFRSACMFAINNIGEANELAGKKT